MEILLLWKLLKTSYSWLGWKEGKVLKKAPKPFQFDCITCNKSVETEVSENKLTGKGCDNNCEFNVTNYTVYAMKKLQEKYKGNENE